MKTILRKIPIIIPTILLLLLLISISACKTTSYQVSDKGDNLESGETTVVNSPQTQKQEKGYTSEGIKKRGIKRKGDRIIVKTQTEDIPKVTVTISYETRLQMLREANLAMEDWKDYEDAIKIANAIIKERPDDGAAHAIKENAQYLQMLRDAKKATRLKKYEDAIKMANAMLEARPDDESAIALKEKARYFKMLRDAKKATKEKEYEDAVKITNEILEARPGDESALALKENARLLKEDRKHNEVMDQLEMLDAQERNKYFENLREKSIPYDDLMQFTTKEKWEDIKKRAQKEEMSKSKRLDENREHTERLQVAPSPSQNLPSQEMRNALNKELSIEFIDTPLSDVVVFLQEKTGVNFVLDKNAAATNVNIKLNDVTVSVVLKYILPDGIDHVVKDNVIHITLESLEMVVYDVRDLLINLEDRKSLSVQTGPTGGAGGRRGIEETAFSPGEEKDAFVRVQEIISLITNTIEPASWSLNGGRGRIAAREGMLGDIVVTHVSRIHKQTNDLLSALRSSADLQIVIEARFIAVSDNFLEEVGHNILDFDTTDAHAGKSESGSTPGEDSSGSKVGGIFTDNAEDLFIGTGVAAGTNGLNLSYQILNGFFLEGFLRAVQESDEAETITAPRITLSNTQRGTIKVVTTTNFIETFEIVSQTPEPVVEEIDSGTTFSVRPVVSADRKYVYLEVHPVITSVTFTTEKFETVGAAASGGAAAGIATNTITLPVTQKQELSVTVCVPDKGILMIGGLGSRTETKTSSGVPILSKIPIIKRLFSSKKIDRDITTDGNLIILIRPTILIREEEEARAFAKGKRDVEFLNPLR